MSGDTLYGQIVSITEEYLGPAASRFIDRQITFHFNKPPHDLTRADLPKLIQWTKVTFGLITEDRRLIEEYVQKLSQLMEKTIS